MTDDARVQPPGLLLGRNPFAWFRVFGPGAVIASLTIGTGELIFSSRGGALFGYHVLWLFLGISLLKWALLYASARHMVFTGAHPFERWMELRGPRGWLPLVFFLCALVVFPVWVSFHAGVLGTLLASLTKTRQGTGDTTHFLWGGGVLCLALWISWRGGYTTLERVQISIVGLMVASVIVSLLRLGPDWIELLRGMMVPRPLEYPPWIDAYPSIAARSVWVESVTYVGVIGGASYDYLAYVSYLRRKGWGRAGAAVASREELEAVGRDPAHPLRSWLRALAIDSGLSFATVVVVSTVFVACGALVLGPARAVPAGNDLLNLQQQFAGENQWLRHLYSAGALLAMLGTLYGTIEVAPAVAGELLRAVRPRAAAGRHDRARKAAILWCGGGAFAVLALSYASHRLGGTENPPGLIAILTPANLFTGVFSCGLVCLATLWADWRFLPAPLRMGKVLGGLNVMAAFVFLAAGIKAYWDQGAGGGGWTYLAVLAGTFALGIAGAGIARHAVGGPDRGAPPEV